MSAALVKGSLGILVGVIFFSIIASSSFGVASEHWRSNLPNKECIIYAESREVESSVYDIYGSAWSNCTYVTFAPVSFIIICLLFAMYLLLKIRSEDLEMPAVLMGTFGASVVTGILSLVQACMVSHGYANTCAAIRETSVKNNLFDVTNRPEETVNAFLAAMDCRFHYNTLDYLYSNVTSGIDTDAAIRTTIGTSWFVVILWFAFIGLTFLSIKKSRG